MDGVNPSARSWATTGRPKAPVSVATAVLCPGVAQREIQVRSAQHLRECDRRVVRGGERRRELPA